MRILPIAILLLGLQARADSTVEIWKNKCKSCHGEDGSADTKIGKKEKIPDMRTSAFQSEWTDLKLKDVIANGSPDNKKMKPFKEKVTAFQLDDLVKFIRGFHSGPVVIQAVVPGAPPSPAPPKAEERTALEVVVFNANRPKTAAPPATPSPPPNPVPVAEVQPLQFAAPAPPEIPTIVPPVKVVVKVSEPEAEPPPSDPGKFGDTWLSILAVALSALALIVALKRKR